MQIRETTDGFSGKNHLCLKTVSSVPNVQIRECKVLFLLGTVYAFCIELPSNAMKRTYLHEIVVGIFSFPNWNRILRTHVLPFHTQIAISCHWKTNFSIVSSILRFMKFRLLYLLFFIFSLISYYICQLRSKRKLQTKKFALDTWSACNLWMRTFTFGSLSWLLLLHSFFLSPTRLSSTVNSFII